MGIHRCRTREAARARRLGKTLGHQACHRPAGGDTSACDAATTVRFGGRERVLMDLLDLLLIVVAIGFAFSGYRQGFLIGVLSFLGFLGGGVLGAKYAPALHSAFDHRGNSALFGLLVVFVFATLGQLLATAIGITLRRRITWQPARTVDAAGGAVVSVVSVLLVAWLVGTALAHSALTTVAREVRHSAVLSHIDDVMPD